jgi:hypothetical protein
MGMTKKFVLVIALMAALAAAGGGMAESGKAAPEEVEAHFDSSFVPKTLPRGRSAPIALSLWGRIQAKERSHPSALSGIGIDGENLGFSVGSRPPCHPSGRQQRLDVAGMRRACRSSILGTGRIEVEVEFPDLNPLTVKSELLILNGDTETTPFIFGYLGAPVTGQLIIPMKVKEDRKPRQEVKAHAAIPKIANGYGSTTYFKLDFKRGVFQASCPHGTLSMSVAGTFPTSNFASATLLRKRC